MKIRVSLQTNKKVICKRAKTSMQTAKVCSYLSKDN